jgi:hypothetical protein
MDVNLGACPRTFARDEYERGGTCSNRNRDPNRNEPHKIVVIRSAGVSTIATSRGLDRAIKVAQAQVDDPIAKSEKHGSHQGIPGERFASGPHGVTSGDKERTWR